MSKTKGKKILSLVLTLCMVLSLLPSMAFAADDNVAINETTKVEYPDLLSAVRAANTGETIKLLKETTEHSSVQVNTAKSITLDLNGKTVNFTTTGDNLVVIFTGATLTITDTSSSHEGKITNTATNKKPTVSIGAGGKVILKNGEIINANTDTTVGAVQLNGSAVFEMEGGKVTATGKQMGVTAFDSAKVDISGGEINAVNIAISTNGSKDASENVKITVSGGKVTSSGNNACGVYLPAGDMSVSGNAEISGAAGIVVRGGGLTVEGGTVTATQPNSTHLQVGNSGNNTPAAGIVVEDVNSAAQQGGQKHVVITGGTVQSNVDGGRSIESWSRSGAEEQTNAPFEISGGKFTVNSAKDENVSGYLDTEDINAQLGSDGTVTSKAVTQAEAEASITENDKITYYKSLAKAIAAAAGGKTVKLEKDISMPGRQGGTGRIELKTGVVIDLNGHTLTKAAGQEEDKAGILIDEGGKLTLTGTGTVTGTGTLLLANKGELVINDSVKIEQKTGTAAGNDTAVAVDGTGKLTINGGTITAEESGVGVFGTGALTVNGGTINAKSHGIATNGKTTQDGAKIEIKGGTVTAASGAGVYLPKGGLEMTDGSVTGAAGIVVRGGKASVTGGTVEATSTDESVEIGDANPTNVAPAAVVVDKSGDSYGDGTATLSGGDFKAASGKPAVAYSEGGNNKSSDEGANKKLTVNGGYYSSSLAGTKLLADNLNTEATTTDGEYGYFSSAVNVAEQMAEDGKTLANISEDVIGDKATIVSAGFIGTGVSKDEANKIINDAIQKAFPGAKNEVTDSGENVFWAIFKVSDAGNYTVEFTRGKKVYKETVSSVSKGGYVYFTPANQTKNEEEQNQLDMKQGEYTVTLKKQSEETALSTAKFGVYRVNYKAGVNVSGDLQFVFTDWAGLEAALKAHPEGFEFTNGANMWNENEYKIEKDTYPYTVTLSAYTYVPPAPGGSGSSATVNSVKATNGSFAISDKNAKAGDTVKITPKANEGYVVDQVTVTDKNGNNITVTQNADGTYSFVMPAKSAQPVDVKVTFKLDDGEKDCPSEKYTDVDQDKWYHEGVDYAIKNGLMEGVGSNLFAPDATTTRAMVVTILYRLDGEPAVTKDIPFADVPAGQWYSNAINWAAANGIVDGYGNGKFGPDDTITREQMAAILYRYASYKGYSVSDLANLTGYTDAASVSEWASTAMRWAVAEGLIEGTSATTLSPSGDSTRAQVATILMRFCEGVVK